MAEVVGRRSVLAVLAAGLAVPALSACQNSGATSPRSSVDSAVAPFSGGPTTLMIIRHAEKPDGANRGITARGAHDSESLTVAGWTRSGALVELFAARGASVDDDLDTQAPIRAGLERPVHVFASDPAGGGSKRPVQTVSALAAAIGTSVRTPAKKGEEAELVDALRTVTGPALVAWQHESIPAIIAHLGVVTPRPPTTWPDGRFDMVYVFRRAAGAAAWTFAQVPQLVLAGDSRTPIG